MPAKKVVKKTVKKVAAKVHKKAASAALSKSKSARKTVPATKAPSKKSAVKTASPVAEVVAPKAPPKAPKVKRGRPTPEGKSYTFAVDAARLLRDDKCEDVVLLDVRGMSQITDYVVIGSGTSERQMRSILHHVEDLGAKQGFQAYRQNVDDRASWVLADFVDVVVHLFEPNTRAHYDLDNLWPDAKRLPWERPDQLERDRAGLHA
jgi:ribosome-associated protein